MSRGTRPGELPILADHAARILGVWERPSRRDPSVEANARLTGATGLLLAVLFVLEGLTIPFIFPLLSWHIAIGLVIVPPLLVKMGSTLWRFTRYYLGDPRFRRAGPPHPLLRLLGPLVMGSTVLVMISGIALWLNGPRSDLLLLRVHQVSFVLWFGCIAVHFASHFFRAVRLAAADSRDAQSPRPALRGSHLRRGLVVASLFVGIGLGVLGREVATGWSHLARIVQVQPSPTVVHPTAESTPPG
ncbi:MAG: hypothetical protein ACYCVN_14900 [Acidimicrobiales bacterium]